MMRRALGILLIAASSALTAHAQTGANPHGTIKDACGTCHTANGWKSIKVAETFVHAARTFPLEGAHARVSCGSCHKALEFSKASTSCASCHQDVHKGELGVTCSTCHTTRSFLDRASMARAHELTRFPLRGAHIAADCTTCHVPAPGAARAQFVNTPTQCMSCHAADYRKAAAPNHTAAHFSTECSSCHTTASWLGAGFDHSKTAFPLTGAHVAQTCIACHSDKVFTGRSTECVSCHQKDYDASKNPPHAGFPTACASCHTTQTFTGAKFDHNANTKFALTGAHITTSCADCHADKVFSGKSQTCVSCHQTDYDRTVKTPHSLAGFPTTCADCHNTVSYANTTFDHSKTRYPLSGAHAVATCSACHADHVYRGKPMLCATCHMTDYNATARPAHAASGFPATCESCHSSTTTWMGGAFSHAATRFPLTGAHLAATCADCHSDGVFRGKPLNCVGCHQTDFNQTTNPHHLPAGFSTSCESCHTTAAFKGARFDHNATAFPLTGAHIAQTCAGCHADRVYKGKPQTCVSCHLTDYNATTTPSHRSGGFPTTCESCHSTADWHGAFDHSKTLFPLSGAHMAATCAACHFDNVYKGKPTTCVSCHLAKYNATTNPKHSTAGFPTDCASCHTTGQWLGATFNHNATAFPLSGAHQATACTDCHVNGVFKGTPTACVSCHQPDFNNSTNPHHVPAGFSTTCTSCHTTNPGWKGTYNHNQTSFPLTGAHMAATCSDCHADRVYNGKPTTCVSCHQTDYNNTTNPKHSTAGFPTDCVACHNTAQWLGATFNHNATAFPLSGAHLAVACTDCHVNGVFKGTPTACVSCHQTDFNNSTNPHHVPAGFSTTCTSCHTTNPGWKPAPYNHSQTSFPLTGAHVTATCLDCHADRVYNGKPTTCVSCHLTDYNNTTNPRHSTAGFPTDCASCHTTSQWLGATFNHDGQFFPIYSGKHKGKWSTCADCHVTPTNYQNFECILCHEHSSKTKVDGDHRQVSGYQYKSTSCYACHPRGN